jgi:glycosyltransferase involved in cell wall biosynthesis
VKAQPLVSILINNYNYGRFVKEAIDSALNQSYAYIEVVVVDDGSTDNSREVISSYGNRIIPVLQENGGQASAFNAGFIASRGDIICFLDADDIFQPEKVATVVTAFVSSPGIGWCFHHLRNVDIDSGSAFRISPGIPSAVYDFRSRLRKPRRARLPLPVPGTSGLCFARSLLQQILPMPEGEDVTISDKYLQCTGLALSKGFFLDEQLADRRIHGKNRFSLHDIQPLTAKINILTAYWLRLKLPKLATYANHLLASGIGVSWLVGGVDAKYKKIINHYLSSFTLLEKSKTRLMAFAYFLWYQVKNISSKTQF